MHSAFALAAEMICHVAAPLIAKRHCHHLMHKAEALE
jgi:hypothetical protein